MTFIALNKHRLFNLVSVLGHARPSHQYQPQSILPSSAASLQTPSCLSLYLSILLQLALLREELSSLSSQLLLRLATCKALNHPSFHRTYRLREQPHLIYATQ